MTVKRYTGNVGEGDSFGGELRLRGSRKQWLAKTANAIRQAGVALGILPDGGKEILGIWIEQTEGAKFWLRVMNELKNRGLNDILIAVVDGLKGFAEAITAVFPETVVQTCIVHLIRHSLEFVAAAVDQRTRLVNTDVV